MAERQLYDCLKCPGYCCSYPVEAFRFLVYVLVVAAVVIGIVFLVRAVT